jgi:hypothetical protein
MNSHGINLDLMLLIQRSFNIVYLLGGYGSNGMGFCPGKENTNLECSLIIAIHHSATGEKFNTICKANDSKRSVDDLRNRLCLICMVSFVLEIHYKATNFMHENRCLYIVKPRSFHLGPHQGGPTGGLKAAPRPPALLCVHFTFCLATRLLYIVKRMLTYYMTNL